MNTETFAGSRTRHGTNSGWRRHQILGERPCDACFRAKAEYDKLRRDIPEKALRNRQAAEAQRFALSRLSHMYPTTYALLYAEELDRARKRADA